MYKCKNNKLLTKTMRMFTDYDRAFYLRDILNKKSLNNEKWVITSGKYLVE